MNLLNVFHQRLGDWFIALFEHLQISLLALLVAIVIAIPLGFLLSDHKKIKEFSLQSAGIMQTIPSLALLGLFIPFTGIGILPAVIALVIYAIFPILQSTLTAIDEIDPALEETATAFGMTKIEKICKYQFPLSLPVIIAGVKTAAVMVIGTATLAALVGAGGLGSFILLGIDRNSIELILIGATSSALLAIIFSIIIKKLENKRPHFLLKSLCLAILTLGLTFVPFKWQTTEKIVIAGKLGAEPEIIINMYKLLIEQESDLQVEIKPNFGKTTFLYEALKKGDIDIYPEYTGTALTTLVKTEVTSNEPTVVYNQAKQALLAQDNLIYLQPTAFQNTYAIAVKKEFALNQSLQKISDLRPLVNQLKAGFSLEFNDRQDGNLGLKSLYGLNLNVATMEPSLRYKAISQDDVQVIDVYSTDSQIITNDLVVLEDDKQLFPPYQAGPLLKAELLEKHPELATILNKLADKINTEEMSKMNYKVDVLGKSAKEVAEQYLKENKLIK